MAIFYSIAMILSAFVTGVAVCARVDEAVLAFSLSTMFFLVMLVRQHYVDQILHLQTEMVNLKTEMKKLFGI